MEELVNYTTAKLAQEKGFDIPTQDKYQFINWEHPEMGTILNQGERRFGGVSNWNHSCFQDMYRQYVSAPTQSQLQKWIREENSIHITIEIDYFDKWHFIILKIKSKHICSKSKIVYNTYEKALEAALEESRKLISLPSLTAGN